MTLISKDAVAGLKKAVKGRVVLPEDADYHEVRKVWNATIDRHPKVIVRCAEAEDVPSALDFARRHKLDISVRGAGHNIAGNAVCEGGIMIDMSTDATVHTSTAPEQIVSGGATPSLPAEGNVRSAFQEDSVYTRLIMPASYGNLRSGAVQSGTNYVL